MRARTKTALEDARPHVAPCYLHGAIACAAVAMLGAGAVALVDACVPADTRPLPGSLTLTVSPSDAVARGVVTVDGWSLAFHRVLTGIGRASLSDTCVVYSDANYDRILDVTQDAGQKLSILHGLGSCDLRFSIGSPTSDALLGAGVTDDDKTRMRATAADPYLIAGATAFEVIGEATQGAVTKRFDFVFRARIRYSQCSLHPDASPPDTTPPVALASQVDLTYDLEIGAEALFRDNVMPAVAALRFAPFAAADIDGDGDVTMDELMKVPIADILDSGAFEAGTYEFDDDAGTTRAGLPIVVDTLGAYVYVVLLPSVLTFRDGGACASGLGFGRGRR